MNNQEILDALRGEDEIRASLAMQELLSHTNLLNELPKLQDMDDSPLLRKRVQQLSSILNRGFLEFHLQEVLKDDSFTNWDVFCQINVILDQQSSLIQIDELLKAIVGNGHFRFRSSEQFADYLREAGFAPEETGNPRIVDYLVSDVLFSRVGSPLVLAVIAERTAKLHNWNVHTGFVDGRPVIRDGSFNVLSPAQHWKITHPNLGEFTVATKRELAIRLLTHVVQTSILEQLHSVTYHGFSLLSQLAQEKN